MSLAWLLVLLQLKSWTLADTKELQIPLRTIEKITLPGNGSLILTLDQDPQADDAFWTFEAHSQNNNDRLSFSRSPNAIPRAFYSKLKAHNHPGLVVTSSELVNSTRPRVFLNNWSERNVTLVLLARNYTSKHPIPGYSSGNLNENGISLNYDADLVRIEFALASVLNASKVGSPILTYEVYQQYLTEQDYDQDQFLARLSLSMLKLDDITKNGRLIDANFVVHNKNNDSFVFSAYPGTGVIFSVVVTTLYPGLNGTDDLLFSTAYVSTATYSCQFENTHPLNCKFMWTTISKVIFGFSIFIGAFVAFFGHRCFQLQQFFVGAYAFGLFGFIVFSVLLDSISYTERMGISIGVGLVGAFIWISVWCFLGIPILSTALPVCSMGLLLGGLFVFLPPLNTISMTSDTVYWLTIGAFMVTSLLTILPFTKTASILSSALLGSAFVIFPIDHYLGSSLKYSLVNLIRRAYVPDFNLAVLYYPFQQNDVIISCSWAILFVGAFAFQYYREKGRAPFPPNPYRLRRWMREERSFLADNAINDAEDEHRPLIETRHEIESNEATQQEQQHRPAVVGYIRREYGSNLATSPSVLASLESPSLYNAQPPGVVPPASPRRFWRGHQNDERQFMSTSVEQRDFFRPPPGHPSQK